MEASRRTFVPGAGSAEITKPLGISELNTSVIVPVARGNFAIAFTAASGVKPTSCGTVYRSGPLETVNLTVLLGSVLSPPAGRCAMIKPSASSSL